MCVIAIKPQGKEPLPISIIATCWTNNPHGAGFVIHRQGHGNLLIQKGFMTLESLLSALDASAIQINDTVLYHFRIATSGSITPANCHPFPISPNVNDLTTLTIACKNAFVHNGILGKGSKELSDTQLYVLNKLSRYTNLGKNIAKISKDTIGSRTAILNAEGQLWLTGKWVEKGGYHYSNETYAYPDWWYDFGDPNSAPDTCEYCQSRLTLLEWGGVLLCEHCSAEYITCSHCGCWGLANDMRPIADENEEEACVCVSCLNEYLQRQDWPEEHSKSAIRKVIERLVGN